ncbi:hypothetical protein HK414_15590 [Ramlibacter terrae]|uniref:Uncharacterized protein n=1 Tax=Ramlibacter terrae TaxID=2732511 RepID=A0ABX6P390_9BURK|nr:hypothetical protein HK414_15590 [Ramlibacter terrae]
MGALAGVTAVLAPITCPASAVKNWPKRAAVMRLPALATAAVLSGVVYTVAVAPDCAVATLRMTLVSSGTSVPPPGQAPRVTSASLLQKRPPVASRSTSPVVPAGRPNT